MHRFLPRPIFRTALFLLLAGLALLGIGAFRAQHNYRIRGLPEDFPTPIPAGGARLGVNVYLSDLDPEQLGEALTEIRQTGFTTIKQPFYYSSEFDWQETDRLLKAIDSQGLEIVPLLDGDPENDYAPPSDLAAFADWAGKFAQRYGDQLRYYIIWDEPNLASHWGNQPPSPTEYGALLSATAAAIRSKDSDAVIVAAPLAPTTETGDQNLSETLFLRELYAAGVAGAFDVVSGKPYGFDTGPDDRRVDPEILNFSRIILLRELLEEKQEGQKAVWAGNFGWNSLPEGWSGDPSLWGQTDEQTQAEHTVDAWTRARQEWPWMGYLFLENWEPGAPSDDPRWGFSVAGRPTALAISNALSMPPTTAYPGFHPAQPDGEGQVYTGTWRFSPDYGADVGQTGDRASFRFWGTDVALRVRRADFRSRLYITIDGENANALPDDGVGSALVLRSGDPAEDYLSIEPVARDLSPGEHILTIEAWRGWEQWLLNGFSSYSRPSEDVYRLTQFSLLLVFLSALALGLSSARKVPWLALDQHLRQYMARLGGATSLILTIFAGAIVALTGWLTWGSHGDGLYRRLGDIGQLALTATAASLFYVTPSFFVLVVALILLFVLIYARPAWGMALIAFSIPFYVLPKPMLSYRFSTVEIFLLLTVLAAVSRWIIQSARKQQSENSFAFLGRGWQRILNAMRRTSGKPDIAVAGLLLVATISLFFTERLDVATNEWRVVILEPALFYLLWRALRLREKEVWTIVDAFVLGGVVVAIYGLWQYSVGENVITVAGGLARLRSIYGSPNNVALYLGRVLPFLLAMMLLGRRYYRWRFILYTLAIIPVGLALLLTFSKGALFLGLPVALLILLVVWRRSVGGRVWPWLAAALVAGFVFLLLMFNIPTIAGRLNLQGVTSILRINLWLSSMNMIREHPYFGVGLDNFLYAYRSRYILDAAWQEPDLNHPHNLLLDFTTRLGVFGLITGIWLFFAWGLNLLHLARRKLLDRSWAKWQPLLAGLLAAFGQTLAHGLVDHSFFLVDLAYAFFLMLGLTLWLTGRNET